MNDETRPPDWALAGARRLTMEEFAAQFGANWRAVGSRILKVERWQEYQEPDTRSLREYRAGRFEKVRSLLEAEAESDRGVYDGMRARDAPFVRLRVVKLPLTEYLAFENWNFTVREAFGETVEIVDATADSRKLPNRSVFDFLLFDLFAALIHDYGTDGLQVGGWSATSPATLERLAATAATLRKRSTPFVDFVASHGIRAS
jgi:hypothetical protein